MSSLKGRDVISTKKRKERNERHNERALQEHSKTITSFPFIRKFEVFIYRGSDKELHNEYTVHFDLINGVLPKDFIEVLENKLRMVIK